MTAFWGPAVLQPRGPVAATPSTSGERSTSPRLGPMQHLPVALNVAINVVGIICSIRTWRKRRAALKRLRKREPSGPLTQEQVQQKLKQQDLVIDTLNEQCERYATLCESQRKLLAKRRSGKPSEPIDFGEDHSCPVCLEAPRDMAFGCGHLSCEGCGLVIDECPICRQAVKLRIKLFA